MSQESNANITSDIKESKEDTHMAVMAKPSKQAFVVSGKDMVKFKNEKTPKLYWKQIKNMAKDFDKYNLNGK